MPEIASVNALLSAFKTLREMIQGAISARDAQAFKEREAPLKQAVIDAQNEMLEMVVQHAELTRRVGDLETQIARLEEWRRERKRYALTEIAPKVFAYTLKPHADRGEPPHMLCAHCYQRGEKAILQGTDLQFGGWVYRCPNCRTRINEGRDHG
jgi:hypothetical protein